MGPPSPALEGEQVKRVIDELRGDLERLALSDGGRSEKDRGRSDKKDKHKKKSASSSRENSRKKKKKKKKKTKGSSSSSSTSSRSRSNSRRPFARVRMRSKARSRSISPGAVRNMSLLKFRKRADLIEFSQKYPGALAAQFALAVHEKLHAETARNEKSLYGLDLGRWARELSQLKEIRDIREVQTLALAMGKIQKGLVPQALDILSQRVKAILVAKSGKGTWDKAAALELLPMTEGTVALSSEIALAGLPT